MAATKLTLKGSLSITPARLRLLAPLSLRLFSQRAEAMPSINLQTPVDEQHLSFDEIPGPQGRLSTAVAFYKLVVKLVCS